MLLKVSNIGIGWYTGIYHVEKELLNRDMILQNIEVIKLMLQFDRISQIKTFSSKKKQVRSFLSTYNCISQKTGNYIIERRILITLVMIE